jgi:hypothetical protein
MRAASARLCVAISADSPVRAPDPSAPRTPDPRCRGPGCRSARRPAGCAAVGQRPAEGHALLLAPRQLRGAVRARRRQPHRRQQVRARASACAPRHAVGQLRQHDVLQRGELGQQVVELIDEPHLARRAAVRAASPSRSCPRPSITTRPHRRIQQPGDMQQRRFARPRGRHQRHHLAPRQRQRGAAQHLAPRRRRRGVGLGRSPPVPAPAHS